MYQILTRDCHLNLGEMNKKKYMYKYEKRTLCNIKYLRLKRMILFDILTMVININYYDYCYIISLYLAISFY